MAASLPQSFSARLARVWERKLSGAGLGGIAATEKYVIFGDRDLNNLKDVFHCLAAADGSPVWTVEYPALGELDYGNTPRATPLIYGEHVYLLGAFGDLQCVKLAGGEIVWKRNLRLDFGVDDELIWGNCSSPLIADDKLIVNPGAKQASLVALDPLTGKVVWQTPGAPHGYGSLIVAALGGVQQIVGHDRESLGGWDAATGKRIWTVKPPAAGDFHVPTPVVVGERLMVVSENNGSRLFRFADAGKIVPESVAENLDLAPDMTTPVVVQGRVFCVWRKLFCLDAATLDTRWTARDDALAEYCALIAGGDRVLIVGAGGRLLLVDARADEMKVVSRLTIFGADEQNVEVYSHPVLVGSRLYIRGETSLVCVDLSDER